MTDVAFYHLARPLEAALPRLLEKALASGERVVVRSDAALLKRLDGLLWTYAPASFLPHGLEGPDAAGQPVLLTTAAGRPANDATIAVIPGGSLADDSGCARLLYLFDGSDAAALDTARAAWRAVKARADATATYWRETDAGRWEQAG